MSRARVGKAMSSLAPRLPSPPRMKSMNKRMSPRLLRSETMELIRDVKAVVTRAGCMAPVQSNCRTYRRGPAGNAAIQRSIAGNTSFCQRAAYRGVAAMRDLVLS